MVSTAINSMVYSHDPYYTEEMKRSTEEQLPIAWGIAATMATPPPELLLLQSKLPLQEKTRSAPGATLQFHTALAGTLPEL